MDGRTHITGGALFGAATPVVISHIGLLNNVMPVEHVVPFTVATMVGGVIGGLLPDIDSPTSLIGRRLHLVSKLVSKTCGHRGLAHTLWANIAWGLLCFVLGGSILHLAVDSNSFLDLLIKSAIEGLIVACSAYFFCESLKGAISAKLRNKVSLYTFVVIFGLGMFLQPAVLVLVPAYLIGTVVGFASHLFLDALTVDGVKFLYPVCHTDVRLMKFHASTGGRIVKPICIILTVLIWIFIFKTMVF